MPEKYGRLRHELTGKDGEPLPPAASTVIVIRAEDDEESFVAKCEQAQGEERS
jgi:hypothetical protein